MMSRPAAPSAQGATASDGAGGPRCTNVWPPDATGSAPARSARQHAVCTGWTQIAQSPHSGSPGTRRFSFPVSVCPRGFLACRLPLTPVPFHMLLSTQIVAHGWQGWEQSRGTNTCHATRHTRHTQTDNAQHTSMKREKPHTMQHTHTHTCARCTTHSAGPPFLHRAPDGAAGNANDIGQNCVEIGIEQGGGGYSGEGTECVPVADQA